MNLLAVRAHRPTIDRHYGLLLAVLLLPVVMCVGFAASFVAQGATYALVVFAAPLVALMPGVVVQALAWSATRRIEQPLEVSRQGMAFDTPRGRLAFPWEAVTGLWMSAGRSPRLTVQLHPQVGPGAPGVVSNLTPAGWRLVRRQGLVIALRAVEIAPAELARAIGQCSGGRWRP